MSDQSKLGIGQLITSEQFRDAIHIAVAPVTAGEDLPRGANVGVKNGEAHSEVKHIGIVDPFYSGIVRKGERFWLFLYPGSITSLRHDWTHPEIAELNMTDPVLSEREDSIRWMTAWAVEHMGYDYLGDGDRLSPEHACAKAIEAGHTMHIGPYESARDYINYEWWRHWEKITGRVKPNHSDYFTCGC